MTLALQTHTASRSALPALNAGALEAAMAMGYPLRGMRPRRAARSVVVNVPNPGMDTPSPLANASPIAANAALTVRSSCVLDSVVSAARSDFFMGMGLGGRRSPLPAADPQSAGMDSARRNV